MTVTGRYRKIQNVFICRHLSPSTHQSTAPTGEGRWRRGGRQGGRRRRLSYTAGIGNALQYRSQDASILPLPTSSGDQLTVLVVDEQRLCTSTPRHPVFNGRNQRPATRGKSMRGRGRTSAHSEEPSSVRPEAEEDPEAGIGINAR